jgi:hypothetical protein
MNFKHRHIIVLFALLSVGLGSYAQEAERSGFDSKLEIGFNIDGQSSSSLNNAMLNASGFIDNNLKDENYERLGDLNRGGTSSDAKIFYRRRYAEIRGIKNLGFYFALEHHYLDENMFTKDLYRLTFYGNKEYAGKCADLTNTARHYLNYYQLKAGLERISGNSRHRYGANLAFNMGNRLNTFRFYEPSGLFTNSTGTELILKSDAEYNESDTARTDWYQLNGFGAGLDIFYEFRKEGKFKILFSIENLGFIRWNNQYMHFAEKEHYSYSGFDVNNVFEISESISPSGDTLMNYIYTHGERAAASIGTPADIKLRYTQLLLSGKVEMNLLAHYRAFSYMMPLLQWDATYALGEALKAGPVLSYGGYTGFNAGLKLDLRLLRKLYIRLESRYITGFAQHSFSGIGGFINFTYKI